MSGFARRWPALFLVLLGIGSAAADIRVQVRETVNDGEPSHAVHWFGDQRSMRDDGNRYIITRLDLGKIFIVNRLAQQYRVIPLPDRPAEDPPAVSVERTDDVREIEGWPARRYRIGGVAAGDMTIDVWISDEVPVDIAGFRRLMVNLGQRPGSEWMQAYRQIPGFPVLQEVTLTRPELRLHSKSRVMSIEQAEPAADTYNPPEGYEQVP